MGCMSDFVNQLMFSGLGDYYSKLLERLRKAETVYLFGGGFNCYRALDWIATKDSDNEISNKIRYVYDNNQTKWGNKIDKYDIKAPNIIEEEKKENDLYLITCGGGHQIIDQLAKYGINNEQISIFTISHSESFEQFPQFLRDHLKEFEAVYSMLADEKSKRVYVNLINFRLTANFDLVQQIADEYEDQYFDREIMHFDDNTVYLDCGAYVGDTVEEYIAHNGSTYKGIISIEADPGNYDILVKNTSQYPNVECINCGVWNSDGTLRFKSMQSGASNFVSDEGEIIVPSKRIDDLVGSKSVTHIKMDIEGAEVPALIGSYNVISTLHPALAICIYHKVDDFITIPLLLKSFCSDYRIYIRQYQKMSALETVCYAVYVGKD